MEIRSHTKILSRARWFFVLMAIIAGSVAFLSATLHPVSFYTTIDFDIQFTHRAATQDYQYGAYYDLKGAELFTQHVMSWFLSPAFVQEIYQEARVGYTVDSFSRFTNRFKTKQLSSQHFSVTFNDVSRPNAEKLAESIRTIVPSYIAAEYKDGQAQFAVTSSVPVIVVSEWNVFMVTIIGMIASFLTSVVLVYIREYFRA